MFTFQFEEFKTVPFFPLDHLPQIPTSAVTFFVLYGFNVAFSKKSPKFIGWKV